jgi:hypothetical protein
MITESNSSYLDFPMIGPREVLANFDGDISSDAGALLLRQTSTPAPGRWSN